MNRDEYAEKQDKSEKEMHWILIYKLYYELNYQWVGIDEKYLAQRFKLFSPLLSFYKWGLTSFQLKYALMSAIVSEFPTKNVLIFNL